MTLGVADQAIVARRHLKPVLAPEVDQGFPRGFAHRGVVHLLHLSDKKSVGR